MELLLRQVVEEDAGGDIILEHRPETPCHRDIVEEDVRLEVVLETAEINISGTAGGHCIIHHEHLAVQVASIIHIHLHTSLHYLTQICARRPCHEICITTARHHQTHIHTTHCGGLHCHKHGLGGHEIRRLYIYIMVGLHQGAHIALHYRRIWRDGTAVHHLHHTVVHKLGRCGRIITATGNHCAVNEIPVYKEGTLYAIDTAARDAHHGVAPRLPVPALHIAVGYVISAHITCLSVDDEYLAVVAVVDLAGELRETDGKEGTYLHTRITHHLEKLVVG